MSELTTSTLPCKPNSETIIHITIHRKGIVELQPKCQLYAMTTTLTANSKVTIHIADYILPLNITTDQCFIKNQDSLQAAKTETLKLDNSSLDKLRYTKHKL